MPDNFSKMSDRKIIRIIVFTVSCLTVIACDNVEQSYEDYFKKGVQFYSQGEYSKAELELKNAIQKKPDAAESYYYLALLNEKSRNFRAMRVNLQEAIKRKPDYLEARGKLAKVHLLFNDLDQATSEVEAMQELQPENLSALTISAQILEKRQKSEESMKIVSQVLEKDADFIDALALKAVLLLKQQSYDEALSTIDHALNLDQDNISFHLLKIQLHGLKNDNAAVIADYQVLSELQPDNDEIKFALAKAYLKNEEQHRAVAILRDLIEDKPANTKAKLMLLELLSVVDRDKSIEELNNFLSASGPDEQIELAKWALSKKNTAKAREILNRLVTEQENDNKAKQTALYLLAGLSFQQRDYEKASKWSEELLRANPDYVDAKVLKAGILLNTGKFANAEELLNNVLWEKPDSDSALVLLAKIYLERGEKDKANNKFLEAFKINPANKQALLPLVDKALKNEHNDYAKELIQTSIVRGAGGLDLLSMLAKINMAEKNWKDAQKVIEVIEKKKNGQLLSRYLTAQMLTQQQKYSQAIELYQQILQQYPWHAASLAAMATSYEKIGKREQMIDYLADFSKKHPSNTASRLLTSRFLVLDNKTDQAIELLEGYLQNNPYAAPVYNELARLFFSQGDKESALKAYQQGLLKKPNDIKLLMSLASFYEQDREPELAIALYEKVLSINPSLDVAKNNLAAILLEQDSEESIARAIELTKTFKQSEQPYFLDSYAWAQYKNKNLMEALTALRRVIILAPDVPVFRYHLAEVYHHQGNDSAAILELREALELGKQSPFAEAESAEKLLDRLLAIK